MPNLGLYSPEDERDSCGIGFVANILGYRSHEVLEKALQAVTNVNHRGALSADGKTGDGAGLLTQIPHKIFGREVEEMGHSAPNEGDLGVMVVFFPQPELIREQCRHIIEERVERAGLESYGWRQVPVNSEALGNWARRTQPVIEQFFVGRKGPVPRKHFDTLLFVVRKEIEAIVAEHTFEDFYIPSFSSRTIVYKGLMASPQLVEFYLDLKNPDYDTALAVYHQRFSTNTTPSWPLAQPFRLLAHNGEINTIRGNRNWMRARERELLALPWMRQNALLLPLLQPKVSDSASLDNAMEAMIAGGREILETVAILIPEAWERWEMSKERRGFYQYHSCFTEPWDGPAALAYSDGRIVGATLDRNGLRPARYIVTDDDLVIMGSEVGIVDIDESHIVRKGRLGPGMMVAVDTEAGRLFENDEIKAEIANQKPYHHWVAEHTRTLEPAASAPVGRNPEALERRQRIFGLTQEDIEMVLTTMADESKDPVYSMGDDTPLAVLSEKPRRLYTYFKQLFAQVTNPPIDPIREEMVMSLRVHLGPRGNFFQAAPEHAKMLVLPSPVLLPQDYEAIRKLGEDEKKTAAVLHTLLPIEVEASGLEDVLVELCMAASRAVSAGKTILILSDEMVDKDHAPIPMMLAVAAVHHHLIREGQRMRASLVVCTGDAFDIHHFACLIGYGAAAVYPHLALETLDALARAGALTIDAASALQRYRRAVDHGILKIMSKMGISALASYHGAQMFEAIGLKRWAVKRYFTGTPSPLGGVGLDEIMGDVLRAHADAYEPETLPVLPKGGYYKFQREEEYHSFNPFVVKALQRYSKTGAPEDYERYKSLVHSRPATALRDLLQFKKGASVPLDEVESVEEVRRRFTTASISYGALSKVAHETLAIAMNRIGGKSGSGEGGEDPERFKPLPNGDSANSAIKQVASGRFGVTTEYLVNAVELEIKMAQGSKPGEGGQLPGHKVSEAIARVRHAQPGVTLISPPPHHDIYSIEDLKQLIYDLKQVNPDARICVKLVSENGVGTIAAGVAKAHADTILISGHEGGTGASPLSSIKNAGSAWELGLAETQQALVASDLRGKVLLRVDGGMKTGRDVVMAAILGAEEYAFGSAVLVAEGCVMVRKCHLNSCPVGITSHRPELIAKYQGTPERVIQYLDGVAGEVREILAAMGARSLDEIIGRSDLLEVRKDVENRKALQLEMAPLLHDVDPQGHLAHRRTQGRNNPIEPVVRSLDQKILIDARDAIEGRRSVKIQYKIRNIDRSVGARLSGAIAKRYGDRGLLETEIEVTFIGSAGQSFGAFLVPGVRLFLQGEANDFVGKGMTGGELILRPSLRSRMDPSQNTIAGNTILYGATGGSVFIAGRVGERFCVRNSGASAVVEGVGDHACEYMTGGTVVILGPTGRNFGAGMSGGVAYVLDPDKLLERRYNSELIALRDLDEHDEKVLRRLIEEHFEVTQSPLAKKVLKRWKRSMPLFSKVTPKDLKMVQQLTAAAGETDEPATATAS